MTSNAGGQKTLKDLVIVGAGPAGSICAMHAAKIGLDVLLVDKAKFPRFKSCGGALSERTKINLGPKGIKSINCQSEGLTVFSPSYQEADYEGEECLNLVVRTEWDHALLVDAKDAGAETLEETMVKDIDPKKTFIRVFFKDQDPVKAKYVVIADGTGLRSYKKKLGFTQPYEYMARTVCAENPIDDSILDHHFDGKRKIQLYFGVVPRGYGWVFPKRGYLNIGIGFSNQETPPINQFEIFDIFLASLKKRGVVPENFDGSTRKTHPVPFQKPFDPTGIGNILLIGDAGGFVSPVTGEGLYYGTTTGRIAAETIHEDIDGQLDDELVTIYKEKWMEDFGDDLINKGLPLANLVYKSVRRMELLVKMMASDEDTCKAAAEMIIGLKSYGEARSKVYRRAPISVLKSLLR
ncbi:MAG: geranylgeranyl reductase family protein [Candidatus Lokiarchaeota archaeon]|nr:geranylgeranyl reductase family protein [Candidatus Lokiarchaeota archaeon]